MMSENSTPPDYKALYEEAIKERDQLLKKHNDFMQILIHAGLDIQVLARNNMLKHVENAGRGIEGF